MILGQQVVSNGGGQSSLELVSNGDININCSQISDTSRKHKISYLVGWVAVHSHRMIYDIPLAKYCDLRNLKFRCRVYKGQSLVPILNQTNPEIKWNANVMQLGTVRMMPCGTNRTLHTTYAAALNTTTHPKTRCRKPYAATQHPMLLMMGVCTGNISS